MFTAVVSVQLMFGQPCWWDYGVISDIPRGCGLVANSPALRLLQSLHNHLHRDPRVIGTRAVLWMYLVGLGIPCFLIEQICT